MPQHELSDYVQLIDSFVHGEISALEFERVYLQMFQEDPTMRPEAEYSILDRLFADVDTFCDDPDLRDIDDLDEKQLRACARTALGRIRALSTGTQD
jgi:Bacterial self-protective colicin-like immunity